jgi:hypothetical protein
MGMDWHSSGITTSVMGALKRSINPNSQSLGFIFVAVKGNFPGKHHQNSFRLLIKQG